MLGYNDKELKKARNPKPEKRQPAAAPPLCSPEGGTSIQGLILLSLQPAQLDLMDLIPAPYGQLHAHWLRRRFLSSSLANTCRSGRTVYLQHKSGRHVPVSITVKEADMTGTEAHVTKDTGRDEAMSSAKFYTVRAQLSTSEAMVLGNRMQLMVGDNLEIRRAVCDESSYGYTSGMLEGQHITSYFEELPGGNEGSAVLTEMIAQGKSEEAQSSYRVGFRAQTGVVVPSVVLVAGSEEGFVLTIFRSERIEAVFEVSRDLVGESGRINLLWSRCSPGSSRLREHLPTNTLRFPGPPSSREPFSARPQFASPPKPPRPCSAGGCWLAPP